MRSTIKTRTNGSDVLHYFGSSALRAVEYIVDNRPVVVAFSYNTPIAMVTFKGDVATVKLNSKKYSPTTSRHMANFRQWLNSERLSEHFTEAGTTDWVNVEPQILQHETLRGPYIFNR
jgi:hypothetical protein